MAADGSVVIEILGDDSKFTSKLQKLAGGAVKGLTTAMAAATTAVAGLAGGAAKVGADFEASMSQVAATMGLTTAEIAGGSAEFELLSQAAKDAGATTAFSASQASEALNYLALAGYDAATAADALPAVLNLAAAGSMDLAYASDLATDAMAALGIEASNANLTAFGDQMARTASKANTSVSQLGEAILTVGGTAKSLVGGTTELNAALGVLANRGIKGAEGGTALRNLILSLSAPTDKAAKTMKSLGLEVYDAAGNLRPLNEVFRDLDAAMAGMTEGGKTQVLNELFNKVDLKSAQAMLAGCGEEFDDLSAAIANSGGAMQDMADTQLDNLQGDLTILRSGLEGLGIAAYGAMQGPLREAVQMATGMVGQIAEAFEAGGLEGAVGAVGDVLAQLVTEFAGAAPKLIDAGAGLLRSLLAGVRQNLPALSVAAVGIVAGLASGVVSLLPQLADTGAALLTELGNQIIANVPQMLPAAVETVAALVENLTANLSSVIDVGIQVITALVEGLIRALPELIAYVPEIVSNIANVINDNAPKLLLAAATLLLELGKGLIESIPTLIANIPKIISAIVDVFTAFSWTNLGKSIITALKNGMIALKNTVAGAAGNVASSIKNTLTQLPAKMLEIGKDIVRGLYNGIKAMAGWIKNQVSNFVGGIVSSVKDVLGIHSPSRVFAEIGDYMARGLGEGFTDQMDRVSKDIRDALPVPAVTVAATLGNTDFGGEYANIAEEFQRRAAFTVGIEMERTGANAAQPAWELLAGGSPAAFDPAALITEIRAVRAEVAKGGTVVMDGKKVGQVVRAEQDRDRQALGR